VFKSPQLATHREPGDAGAGQFQDLDCVFEAIGLLQSVRLGHSAVGQCDEGVSHDATGRYGSTSGSRSVFATSNADLLRITRAALREAGP
jgi:hypothetical protein